jgi:3-oxoacyl-[acyl-carrier-protein] synthase-3
MKTIRAQIRGTGSSLPKKVLTNDDLEKIVDTTDEWIVTRTGIKQRHIAEANESLSTFANRAAEKALDMAGMRPEDLDMIICATVTPDMPLPATACFIQQHLGARHSAAFDISAACSGFIFALSIANQFIATEKMENILIVGGEILSKFLDWEDRATCIIFADGAGATVLSPTTSDKGILATSIHTDGTYTDFLQVPAGGTYKQTSHETVDGKEHYIKMKGNELFKVAIRYMERVSREVLDSAQLTAEDINHFIPHQANERITQAVASRLKIDRSVVYSNISRIGNTSSGSIPIALDEMVRDEKLNKDDLIVMSSFGGGVAYGAALIRW